MNFNNNNNLLVKILIALIMIQQDQVKYNVIGVVRTTL